MSKYRNISGRTLSVRTERGFVDVPDGEVVEHTAAYEAAHYIQTGEQGEPALWEPVDAGKGKAPKGGAVKDGE